MNAQRKIAARKPWMESKGGAWKTAEMAFGWVLFTPYYPCPWTLDRGPLSAPQDGPKWTCGLPEIEEAARDEQSRCIVYSFGSRRETSFERRVFELAPSCEVHIFDQSAPVRPAPTDERGRAALYHCQYLLAEASKLGDTLASTMQHLGHPHVDVLKMDIEGAEWPVFKQVNWSSAHVGQIQVEIHPGKNRKLGDLMQLFALLEDAGFRAMSVEPVNFSPSIREGGSQPVEFVFLHRSWTPAGFALHAPHGTNHTGTHHRPRLKRNIGHTRRLRGQGRGRPVRH